MHLGTVITLFLTPFHQSDTTGKLGFQEFKYLWNNIKKWQAIYKQFDVDRSGTICSSELPGAFEAAGFHLNEHLYNMIIRRYSDEGGNMDFDNFISCLVRLDAMFRAFKSLDKNGTGQIQVNIQEVRTPVLGCGSFGSPSPWHLASQSTARAQHGPACHAPS
uniref:Calpain small subunit 1 n=1 Tax=Ursus americanus TaxID=9643 RepID=A0A452S3H7_URSAM